MQPEICWEGTHSAQMVRALHTAHLDIPMLSSGDDLYTLKVAGQYDDVTAGAIGLRQTVKEEY